MGRDTYERQMLDIIVLRVMDVQERENKLKQELYELEGKEEKLLQEITRRLRNLEKINGEYT